MKRKRWQRLFSYTNVNHGITWYKTLALRCINAITLVYSRRKLALKLDKLAQQNNGNGYHRCFECAQGMLQRKPFNKELFDTLVPYPFEDRFFLGFKDSDSYLTNAYGNYMELPPEEKRVTHHAFKAYKKE